MSRVCTAMTDSCAPKYTRSPTLPAVAAIMRAFSAAVPPTDSRERVHDLETRRTDPPHDHLGARRTGRNQPAIRLRKERRRGQWWCELPVAAARGVARDLPGRCQRVDRRAIERGHGPQRRIATRADRAQSQIDPHRTGMGVERGEISVLGTKRDDCVDRRGLVHRSPERGIKLRIGERRHEPAGARNAQDNGVRTTGNAGSGACSGGAGRAISTAARESQERRREKRAHRGKLPAREWGGEGGLCRPHGFRRL
jgi:hypothetical protein